MNYKKFFKIVFLTVFYFCLISSILLGTVFFLKPDLLSNNIGRFFYPSAVDRPTNVLFLGLDKVSRSTDVIVLVNFSPKDGKVNVLSIPRDTKVSHNGKTYKVNAMYAVGKEELAKEKIGEIIGQKVDYVVVANPEGFRNIIDILDGVEVNVPRNMNYDDYDQGLHIHLKKGLQVLDGKKAEQFVRYRHGYTEGDLGRIDAQQIFFKAFMEQKMNPKYLFKADKILREVFNNVETNMTLTDALKYAVYAKDLKMENVNFCVLPGEPKRTSAAWYFICDPVKTQKLVSETFSISTQGN